MLKNGLYSLLFFLSIAGYSQQKPPADIEQLKAQILSLREDVSRIELNLATSEKKFKRGILVATIGYSLVITGGLMLGRENDRLGQRLLVAGGITGAVGTVLLVDSFKYLGRAGRKKKS
jgi:hypothetical protein